MADTIVNRETAAALGLKVAVRGVSMVILGIENDILDGITLLVSREDLDAVLTRKDRIEQPNLRGLRYQETRIEVLTAPHEPGEKRTRWMRDEDSEHGWAVYLACRDPRKPDISCLVCQAKRYRDEVEYLQFEDLLKLGIIYDNASSGYVCGVCLSRLQAEHPEEAVS